MSPAPPHAHPNSYLFRFTAPGAWRQFLAANVADTANDMRKHFQAERRKLPKAERKEHHRLVGRLRRMAGGGQDSLLSWLGQFRTWEEAVDVLPTLAPFVRPNPAWKQGKEEWRAAPAKLAPIVLEMLPTLAAWARKTTH